MLNHRTLGKTGLSVSELGYGTWGLASSMWVGADDEQSLVALRTAIEAGVNFIDTALAYGDGRSERLVGQALRDIAAPVHVATKVPPIEWPEGADMHASEAFTAAWITECAERSLTNLGVDTLDLLQLHTWLDHWLDEGDWIEGVERLRKDGKVQHFGVSVEVHDPNSAVALVRSGLVDTVQVIYNVFDQSPENELFPAAQAENVGVIVRVPLDEGGLSGHLTRDTVFPDGDWRNDYFGGDRRSQVEERAGAITDELGLPAEGLAGVALRFCLSHPAVSTVIPGMRSVEHVRANISAAAAGPLREEELAVLRRHRWERNFYEDP